MASLMTDNGNDLNAHLCHVGNLCVTNKISADVTYTLSTGSVPKENLAHIANILDSNTKPLYSLPFLSSSKPNSISLPIITGIVSMSEVVFVCYTGDRAQYNI